MRRIQIIVNNGAGTGQAHRVWNETQCLLRGYKIKYEAHMTRYEGHAAKLAEQISRGLSNTFVAYMKYFISVVFEAVTMALAILLCNQFISSGLPTFTGDYEDWAKTLIYLGEMTFTVALTVGTVKGAQNLTSRALGL